MKSESHNLQPSKKICKKTCKNKNFSYNNNTHETAFRSEVCPATGDDLTCGFFWNKKIVNVYIDWFNHYHSLFKKINEKWSNRSNEYKRCDLRKLAQSYLSEDEKLNKVYFFTALSERDKPARERHETYIQALRKMWTDVILWKFNKVEKCFKNWKNILEEIQPEDNNIPALLRFTTYEEKETDVNIALKIFEDWIYDNYDKAIIVSWDSDIIPAIRRINELAKKWKIRNKEFSALLFPRSRWKMIVKACKNNRLTIDSKHIEACLFPNKINLWHWKFIRKPKSWK